MEKTIEQLNNPPPNQKITDEQIEIALISSGGQPTQAAKLLGVDYLTVWRRSRQNPALLEVQKAYRGKTFNDMSNMSTVIAMAGIIKEPKVNKVTGEVIKGEFVEKKVDYRTRINLMTQIMGMLKGEEGIKDHLIIENDSPLDLSKLSDEALCELQNAMNSEVPEEDVQKGSN